MIVAVLNYLYHPVLSRLLSVPQFGEVQAIFSLSVQIGILLSVLGIVVLNIAANAQEHPEREAVLADLQSLALYALGFCSLVLLIFSPQLARAFQFDSVWPFFILVLILLTTVPITFRRSYLQAHTDFKAVSTTNVIIAAGRLAIAAALVILGFGVGGALMGLVVAQLLALIYVYSKTRDARSLSFSLWPALSPLLKKELRYIWLTLSAFGFVAFLISADVLFAKYLFDPATAGAYSGISTVARIIYFSTASIAAVLLPSVRLNQAPEVHQRLLWRSLMMLLSIATPVLALLVFAPEFITKLLIGEKFIHFAYLLPRLACMTLVISIMNLFISYFLSLRRYTLLLAVAAGVIGIAAPLYMHHAVPLDIINAFLIGSSATLALLVILFLYVSTHSPQKNNHHNARL